MLHGSLLPEARHVCLHQTVSRLKSDRNTWLWLDVGSQLDLASATCRMYMYTVSQKTTRHQTLDHNFAKCWQFSKFFQCSLTRKWKFAIKITLQIPPRRYTTLRNINVGKHSVPYMLGHCFLKYKLARDMTYGRQQLLWQKQVTVIGSIDLDFKIDEYHTDVAQFRHVVCHRRSVRR